MNKRVEDNSLKDKRMPAKVINRSLCLILAAVMVFTAMPVFALSQSDSANESIQIEESNAEITGGNVTPERVNDAISKFSDSLSRFLADTSKLSEVSEALFRFGGVTSAASGVIGFLQMLGIIQDPTKATMEQILNEVHNIEDKLKQMDTKIDRIQKDLVDIAVVQEEKDRANKALAMRNNWADFNTNYTEPLDDRMAEYQGKINSGIRAWWKQSSHDGIYVLFTMFNTDIEDGEDYDLALTFSNESFGAGMPATADNGEKVAQEYSFGVPASYMPDTASIRFSIGSYQSDFRSAMAKNFYSAANAHDLIASDEVYSLWDDMTEKHKREFAEYYSEYILNSQLYHIACDVMSDNDDWVISVMNQYKHYCEHILARDSGVDAMLNAMYLTHGFEGEIKDDISEFCDSMVVKAGVYGQFALACAGQDELQSAENVQNLQDLFTDTVIALNDKENYALTGHDNFCYVTGTCVSFDKAAISAHMEYTHTKDAYKESYVKGDWKLTSYNYLDDVYSQVLYHQYQTLSQGNSSFISYLNKYGTGIQADYSGRIMTKYNGGVDFSLNEGIEMKAEGRMGKYFWNNKTYRINAGNDSKIQNQYFVIHDKAMYDVMDMKDETIHYNQMAGARALYGEHHQGWIVDEVADFRTTDLVNEYKRSYINNQEKIDFVLTADILKLSPAREMNGEENELDPFFSFDGPVLSDASSIIGPLEDNKSPLTGIKLRSYRFTYTGKAIEPNVTAVSEKGRLTGSGYEIRYSNNRDVGYASVTVKGLGDYSGTVSRQYRIVPKGTAIRKIRRGKASVSVRWKKQSESMPADKISGYQINYSMSPSMKNAMTLTVKGYKNTGKKITGLKRNRKYWFRIRTYMKTGKDSLYSEWSAKKAVKTK